MFAFKNKYFFIIESIKDIDLRKIKKRNKFVIIYRYIEKQDKIFEISSFRKQCKSRNIKFFVANNLELAKKLSSDGIYLSAKNKEFKYLYFKKNFSLIGGAHNLKEINLKIMQGCKKIVYARLFKVTYKPQMNYLGVIKFNYLSTNTGKKIIPLGGINYGNLNKLKLIKCDAFAVMSEIKKKPAIIGRLF